MAAKQAAIDALRKQIDQYALICDHLRAALPQDGILYVTSPCRVVHGVVVYSCTSTKPKYPLTCGCNWFGPATAIGASVANPDKK